MSAPALSVPRPGWPAPAKPGSTGYCQTPHWWTERKWKICATPTEVGVVDLILDRTRGYQQQWAELAVEWFAERLGVDERSVQYALSRLTREGYIVRDRSGRHCSYRVDLNALAEAPDYEAKPELVRRDEPKAAKPTARHVAASNVHYYGHKLERYHGGELLIADQRGAAATVSRCGQCETVAIVEMIASEELTFEGEEKAKGETGFTPGKGKRAARDSAPQEGSPVPSTMKCAWHWAVHQKLCEARPLRRAPSPAESLRLAEDLGESGALEMFLAMLRPVPQAKTYHYLRPLAQEARQAWEADQGTLCPCGRTRLQPGVICAHCGPKPEAWEPAKHPLWDPVKKALAEQLASTAWRNWVYPTEGIASDNGALRVRVPDQATEEWLRDEYGVVIQAALRRVHGDRFQRIEYEVDDG